MKKVAILVDGGFYKKRAQILFGGKSPEERANELISYCMRHVNDKQKENSEPLELYRIFYYDCHPSDKNIYNPVSGKTVRLKNEGTYEWNEKFFIELLQKRKVALRMGELLDSSIGYRLKVDITKKLCRGEIQVEDLKIEDFDLEIKQKGVDMRIGLDIASLAYKKQVERIVLIAGDSDFVPAAKHARREGIDFILDPLWQSIKPSLMEHIDGLVSKTSKPNSGLKDSLCVKPKLMESVAEK